MGVMGKTEKILLRCFQKNNTYTHATKNILFFSNAMSIAQGGH
jgi:hypothetical protein